MHLFRPARAAGRSPFRPQVEALEGREVPALLITNPTPGGTWALFGDGASDTVVVTDNGTGAVNNITLNVNGTIISPNASIWELRLYMGGGNDQVIYNLTQPLTSGGYYHELELDLGSGHDYFAANLPGTGQGAAGMNLYVNGRDGNDTIRVNVFGTLAAGSGVGMGLTGGAGADMVVLDAYTRPLNIAAGALLWANFHGLDGWSDTVNNPDQGNRIALDYRGELDGRIAFNMHGAGGNDWMRVWIEPYEGVSTGYVGDPWGPTSANVLAGAGNDDVTFRMPYYGGVPRLYYGVLDAGWGWDIGHYSTDIDALPWGLTVLGVEVHDPHPED